MKWPHLIQRGSASPPTYSELKIGALKIGDFPGLCVAWLSVILILLVISILSNVLVTLVMLSHTMLYLLHQFVVFSCTCLHQFVCLFLSACKNAKSDQYCQKKKDDGECDTWQSRQDCFKTCSGCHFSGRRNKLFQLNLICVCTRLLSASYE